MKIIPAEIVPSLTQQIDTAARKTECCAMERFIHNENIRRYRKLLEEEPNEEKRNAIRKLLAEEEAKEVRASPEGRRDNSKHP